MCDSEGMLGVGSGRPSEALAGFCGTLPAGLVLCERGDPRAKGRRRAPAGFFESNFEPGRSFANPLYFQDALDRRYDERANMRFHRTLRCRAVNRLAEASRDVRSRQRIVEPTRRQA